MGHPTRWSRPPPLFGKCPKFCSFFFWRLPLGNLNFVFSNVVIPTFCIPDVAMSYLVIPNLFNIWKLSVKSWKERFHKNIKQSIIKYGRLCFPCQTWPVIIKTISSFYMITIKKRCQSPNYILVINPIIHGGWGL